MPAIKKKETEGNVKNANRSKRERKRYKRSIIPGASTSITPTKFVYPVITRSKAKLFNQSDLININNQFSLKNKRKRKNKRIDLKANKKEATPIPIIIIDNEIESSVFPSTSSQDFSNHKSSPVTNDIDSSHSEKMEITENFASTSTGFQSVLKISKITEEFSKINNEQNEINCNVNNSEQSITLMQQSNDQYSLNECCDRKNDMDNLATTAENVQKDISGLLNEEIWKTKQLYHLQEDIVRMENKKLDTFKRIFKKLYQKFIFQK